jgi:hypothetical protein
MQAKASGNDANGIVVKQWRLERLTQQAKITFST